MWKPFLPERVLEHDGFCPTWTYRDQTAVDPKQGFDAADVTLGTGRKIFDLANIAKLGIPAVELLIHWDCALNVFGIGPPPKANQGNGPNTTAANGGSLIGPRVRSAERARCPS